MKIELEQVVAAVSQFVTKTRGAPPSAIAPDTRLYQEGHVDSFGIVELIAELETTLALRLPPGALIPEDFESPRVLWARLTEL